MAEHWKQVVAPWPVLPPQLWLTGAATALTLLSLVFNREIWMLHPYAVEVNVAALVVLLLLGGTQILVVLWKWPRVCTGPRWVRLLVRLAAVGLRTGIALFMLPLAALGCLFVGRLLGFW